MFFDSIPSMVDVFLVGGAVRDKQLGVGSKDLDFIIHGLSSFELMPKVLHMLGCEGLPQKGGRREFVLDPVGRMAKAKHPVHGVLDFKMVDNVMRDLKDRDFTVNAMAIDCRSGLLFDPLKGSVDLQYMQLVPCKSDCFLKSPERLFRALRFQAKGFNLSQQLDVLADDSALLEVVLKANADRMAQQADKMFADGHAVVIFQFFAQHPRLAQAIFGSRLQLRSVVR